jgi:hypothetical protein
MDLSLKWIGKPENAIIDRMRESARREVCKHSSRFAASPRDVRKAYGFPAERHLPLRLRLRYPGRSNDKKQLSLIGKAEPFRVSGGRAAAQELLDWLVVEKAKAPTSPKVGALPFSLSSHKENRWTHTKPDFETEGCENIAMNL